VGGSIKDRGFTLVELVCVVALLSLIALIAVPSVASVGSSRTLEIAARGLAMELRRAQQKAITTGSTQAIDLRIHSNDYRVRDLVSGDAYTVKLAEGVTYRSVNFPVESGHPRISFYRSGAPSRGGTIVLSGPRGKVSYIIVTPATGRVRVSDQPPEN
jgi:prepilin-type N-terminal cleavage/methylation domain-containing protein